MMHLLALCLVSFLIVPTHALEVSTTHWHPTPSVVPTSIPTVFPTSAPTATPTSTPNECPPGCLPSCIACATQNGTIACYQGPFCPPGSSPDPGYPHHGHTHKVNIETNIAIQHFTINVGRIDVDINARENLKSHGGHGHGPVISSADHDASTSSSPSSSSPPSQGQCPPAQAECEKPNRQVVCCPYPINITVCCLGSPPTVSHHTDQPNIQTDIAIGDFTMNVGAIDVDVNKCKRQGHSKPPTWFIITPPGDDTIQFPDDPVSTEPGSDEIVLGESDVSTQGLPPIGGVSTAPAIYSFTYKISTEKNVQVDTTKRLQQVVTFIIRGAHFDISSLLGVDGSDLADGLASLLQPKVFLGAIPLKVVRFTDTYIEARFEDIEDQQSFKPGSYSVRVKVLHVGHKLGILSTDSSSSEISTLGGLSLPELGIIGSGIPVLPVIKSPPPIKSPFTLISLFAGLQFDVASLTVTFSSGDADKIAKVASVMYYM